LLWVNKKINSLFYLEREISNDALKQSCDEIDKAIKSGDMSKFHTIEELFDELDEEDDESIDNNN
jgi:tRNA threonylcarbamoyladenosine modification (KEOPS) complex Cgi121 subunit